MHKAMTAQLTHGSMAHLKQRGQKINIRLLKSAVERLCIALTQKSAGQRDGDSADKTVNFSSPEIDLCQYTILCEAVALVLSGKLDGLDDNNGI